MNPIDYGGAFANLPPPGDTFVQGFQNGAGIQQVQMQQQQQALALQQAEAARQQQIRMQAELSELSQNPTTDAISRMSIKYPQLSENFKRTFDMLEPAQKQAKLQHASQVYAAIQNGKPEIAEGLLARQAEAFRNSGDEEEAKAADTWATLIKEDPEFAKTNAGLLLSAAMGPDKFATTFASIGKEAREAEQAPGALRKVEADAEAAVSDAATKAVTAKFAEQGALLDIEKKGWDVKKIKADIQIAKEDNRIKAMNAAYNREGNDLKRQELRLKIDDAARARDEKVKEKVAQAEGEIAGVTDTVALIDEIFADPDTLKAVTGASAWRGAIPGTKSRTAAGKIEQLTNMLAAANLDKLKGPMSDKDILFVKRISGNIDRYQDEELFATEMGKVRDIMQRTEKKLRAKYGAPDVDHDGKPDPAGAPRNIVVDY